MTAGGHDWHVIVPIKSLARAKSRLALPPAVRRELVLAMALDTLDAIAATRSVDAIWVVTSDIEVADRATAVADHVVVETASEPSREDGLNAAVTQGAIAVHQSVPGAPVAVVMADLPALRSMDFARVLAAASGLPLATVPDSESSGTTVLLAAAAETLRPSFGPQSHRWHRHRGAIAIEAAVGVRRDVDTLDDLQSAATLGVGSQTALILSRPLR